MPLLALVLVVAVVLGLTTTRRVAVIGTAAATAAAYVAFTWAVVDGRGDDPVWLLALPALAGASGLWITQRLAGNRATRTS